MTDYAFGSHWPPLERKGPEYVDIEVHDGVSFVSLNDRYNYQLTSKSLETSAQGLRPHTVSSPLFDGEFVVHSTLGNVTEIIEVYVFGADQVTVSDNIEKLKDTFTRQPMYQIRKTLGNDVEIWRCFPAEYSISRGHVNIHNRRATMTFSVPRLPKVTREVME